MHRRPTSPVTVPKPVAKRYSLRVMKKLYFPVAKQTAISTTPSSATVERGATAARAKVAEQPA